MDLTNEDKKNIIRILKEYQMSILESVYDQKKLNIAEDIIYKLKNSLN